MDAYPKPIVIVDGKWERTRAIVLHVCAREIIPNNWYRQSRPTGETYAEVFYQDGTREIIPGPIGQEFRPSHRAVFRMTRQAGIGVPRS